MDGNESRSTSGNPSNLVISGLPLRNKLMLALGAAALMALAATALMWSRTPDYKALFANVSERDAGAVIAALSQLNVPYRFSEVGGVIMVPAERLHETRVRLAAQGLPKGGQMGFELVEAQKFGTTQFQERLNYQRGLEGELARSIMALGAVSQARVHLALPATHGFFRDQQKPSASVLVTLYPGQVLDRSQIGGIVHLVSSSVPELSPKQVSVVDQTGALISAQADNAQTGGLDATQLHYRQAVEQAYISRIIEILEPIVGRGNVKAQVTADLDFTVTESTAEQFRPNQGNEPAAVRSQQVNESSGPGANAAVAGGIPGALTNQPPVPPTAPINAQGQPGAAATPSNTETRRESTTNFEVDKTVRVVRNATGTLRRLTAAVVVNHRKGVDKKGKPITTPLAEAEMTQIQALVQEAMGFSKDRGDSLQVANVPFTVEEVPAPEPVPIWREPEIMSVVRSVGLQLGLVLLGLLILFGVIKPALKRQVKPVAKPTTTERVVANDVALPPPAAPTEPTPAHEDTLRLARDNPATVANVVRSWINA